MSGVGTDFGITLEEPTHGWLPIELMIDGEVIKIAASDVLNDPVYELAAAGHCLVNHSHEVAVNCWTEPYWHVLVFDNTLDQETTQIRFYLDTENKQLSSAENIYQTAVPTLKLCRHIGSTLRSFIHACGHENYQGRSKWAYKFPDDKITELYSAIRDKKGVK